MMMIMVMMMVMMMVLMTATTAAHDSPKLWAGPKPSATI